MGKLLDDPSAFAKSRRADLDRMQEQLAAQISERESGRLSRPALSDVSQHTTENPQEQMRSSLEYRRAVNSYMRTGDKGELRALGTNGGDGSTLVPTGFQREIEVYRKAIGGPRLVSRVVSTATGNSLPWPTEQDTSNAGTWLAESASTSEVDPTFSSVQLGADLLSSNLVLVPVELMQDSAFSMEATLAESFGIRLARGSCDAYTNGNGANIPGLLPELVSAGGRSVLAVGGNNNSGNSADTDLNSIGTDDFSALITAVDKAYRTGDSVYFMGNQSAFDKVRNLKDKYGRPIWQASLSEGTGDLIDGYPWVHNQFMENIGAGNVSMIFGNFSKYIIRDVLGMTMIRYNELFMQNRQIGFEAYLRSFGRLLNAQAFSYLIHPDS
jgi:HK97 family phage major capsid protein